MDHKTLDQQVCCDTTFTALRTKLASRSPRTSSHFSDKNDRIMSWAVSSIAARESNYLKQPVMAAGNEDLFSHWTAKFVQSWVWCKKGAHCPNLDFAAVFSLEWLCMNTSEILKPRPHQPSFACKGGAIDLFKKLSRSQHAAKIVLVAILTQATRQLKNSQKKSLENLNSVSWSFRESAGF